MGYESTRNKGLASLDEQVGARLWEGWGNNIATRFVSQGFRASDDIVRGLARMGGSVLSDVVAEPIRGLVPGGDAGLWRDEENGGVKSSIYQDLVNPMAQSMAKTGAMFADYLNPVEYQRAFSDPENSKLRRHGQELVDNPFEFALEHVGNASLTGLAAGKAGQLGVAARRGAITGGQAAQGLRPLAGRGVRATARQATKDAAGEGNLAARGSLFAEDIVGHPIRAAAKKISGSRPAELFRTPRPQQEVRNEALANIRRFRSEEGSFDFRPGDLRRDWNEVANELNKAGAFSDHAPRLQAKLQQISESMRARGMEPPDYQPAVDDGAPLIDPNEVALREPDAVETVEDFQWATDDPGMAGEGFTRGMIDSLQTEVEILGGDLTPDTIHSFDVGTSKTNKTAYYVNKSGRVAGVVEVDPYMGINIAVDSADRGRGVSQQLLEKIAEANPDMDWQSALKNTTTSEFGTRLQEKMRQRMAAGDIRVNPEAQGSAARRQHLPSDPNAGRYIPEESVSTAFGGETQTTRDPLRDIFSRLDDQPNRRGMFSDETMPPDVYEPEVYPPAEGVARVTERHPRGSIPTSGQQWGRPRSMAEWENQAGVTGEAVGFRDLMREAFGSEAGSIANPFARQSRADGLAKPTTTVDLFANEAGILKEQFLSSELGQRFSQPARQAREILRDRNLAMRQGEGPIAQAANNALATMRGRGSRGIRTALDARTTEAKFISGIRNLKDRAEGKDYGGLVDRLHTGQPKNVGDRFTAAGEVVTGKRPVGGNIPADKLADDIVAVFEEARGRARNAESLSDEITRIVPGIDAESLSLLGLNAIEKANGLADGSLTRALGDYVQGDKYLLDVNRRAQALMESAGKNTTPRRFRISDEDLSVNVNDLPEAHKDLFFEAARQRRVAQRFFEEAKLANPNMRGHALFNTRSGTRIGLKADDPTYFGVHDQFLNEVLGKFDMSMKDFGGNVDAALDALDEVQGEFFDVDLKTIELGNPTQSQKNRLKRRQKEFEDAQRHRTEIQEELAKIGDKEQWSPRDWERYESLRAADKQSLNQLIESAARLGKLRETVSGSLDAAPVAARNLMLYAREVVPEQIKTLENMKKNGVGDAKAIDEIIGELKAVPKTLDELNDAQVYVSYLKDLRDMPRGPGAGSSATRAADPRRRGTNVDAAYNQDFRDRLFAQDLEFQRHYITKAVRDTVAEKGLSRTGRSILESEEFGYTPDQVSKMTIGEIQDILSQKGYRAFNPDALFELRRTAQGNPLDAQWMREDVGNILTKGLGETSWAEHLLEATYDKALRGWKMVVLPLRPAWNVNNQLGNALLSMLVGKINVMDYPAMRRASKKAVKSWEQGLARTLDVPLTKGQLAELQGIYNSTKDAGQKALLGDILERGAVTLDNTIMNQIVSGGTTRGDFAFLNNSQFFRTLQPHEQGLLRRTGLRQSHPRMPKSLTEMGDANLVNRAAQRGRNLRATGKEVVDYAYHVNETVDNMHRAMVYVDQIAKGSDHATALAQVNKALGDYNKLSSFERRVVRRIYPFWPWMRHMLEVVGRSLSPTDINRTVMFAHITSIFGEANEYEELLPEYAAGDIFMGIGDEGTPLFLSTRGANPFLDVFDPITQPNLRGFLRPVAPPIGIAAERISGVSNLTGRPFSSPIRPADQQLPRPPLSEQIINQLPHAKVGRDVYRDLTGQPLTRYGTGEPALFPGAENDKSALKGIGQLFGANIRPMNVEQMKVQESKRLFQEASDRARQEARERANALENARSLPSLFR